MGLGAGVHRGRLRNRPRGSGAGTQTLDKGGKLSTEIWAIEFAR